MNAQVMLAARLAAVFMVASFCSVSGCSSSRPVPPAPLHPHSVYTDGNLSGQRTQKGWEYSIRTAEPALKDCNGHGMKLLSLPDDPPDSAAYVRAAHYVNYCVQSYKKSGEPTAKEVLSRASRLADSNGQADRLLRAPPFVPTEVVIERQNRRLMALARDNKTTQERNEKQRTDDKRTIDALRRELDHAKRQLIDTNLLLREVQDQLEYFHNGPGAQLIDIPQQTPIQ